MPGDDDGNPGHGEACGSLAFSAADLVKVRDDDGKDLASPYWDPIIAGVKSWPTHDLFPTLGIPAHG